MAATARRNALLQSSFRLLAWTVAVLVFFHAPAFATSSADLLLGRTLAVALGVALWCTRPVARNKKPKKSRA